MVKLTGNASISLGAGCTMKPPKNSPIPEKPCGVCGVPTNSRFNLSGEATIEIRDVTLKASHLQHFKHEDDGSCCIHLECARNFVLARNKL